MGGRAICHLSMSAGNLKKKWNIAGNFILGGSTLFLLGLGPPTEKKCEDMFEHPPPNLFPIIDILTGVVL